MGVHANPLQGLHKLKGEVHTPSIPFSALAPSKAKIYYTHFCLQIKEK